MNQAALWAGIVMTSLSFGSIAFAFGRHPDQENTPPIFVVGILEFVAAVVFFFIAYAPKI